MRKTINIIAFIFFIWLVVDALNLFDALTAFLLTGIIPGSDIALSPNFMIAATTLLSGIILFELAARRFAIVRNIRYYITHLGGKQDRLPKRRFSRI